jgi:hypothetical protein
MLDRFRHPAGFDVIAFGTPNGRVWAIIDAGETEAALTLADEASAVSGGATDKMLAARNRYGYGAVRGILREIQGMFPGVRRWVWARESGGNPGRFGAKEV